MACSLSGSWTTTDIPRGSFIFCRLKFRQAILAFATTFGIAVKHNRTASHTHTHTHLVQYVGRAGRKKRRHRERETQKESKDEE